MGKWILSIACIVVALACYAAGDAGVTIVGRGDAAQEVGKGGAVREIPKSELQFKNQSRVSSAPRRPASPAPEKPSGKKAEPKSESAPAKPAVKEMSPDEKARIEAVKQANIEKIRKVRQLGGWIYDKNGQPISNEELDRRIEEGKLDDIKAISIHQEQLETESTKDRPPKREPETKREER